MTCPKYRPALYLSAKLETHSDAARRQMASDISRSAVIAFADRATKRSDYRKIEESKPDVEKYYRLAGH